MKSFTEYLHEETKEVVVAWGRFNPPTIGHEKLMDAVKKVARNGTYRIYASQSTDPKKNPLDYASKVKFMRKMFPRHARSIMMDKGIRTLMDLLTKLYDDGFTKVTLVAGSDRVPEYEVLANKYNKVKGRHGFYNFDGGVNVVSAGQRDPDAEGATGMSASKMRAAATDNDFQTFSKGMPKDFKDGQKLFNAVRTAMGLKESYEFRSHIQLEKVSDEREAYVRGELYEQGDIIVVKETQEIGTVIQLGANHVLIETSNGKFRMWLDQIEPLEEKKDGDDKDRTTTPQDPDIKDKEGSQPATFHKGIKSKSTKDKRDAHFKKYGKKADDDPSAYKPAPGDATAKTKPSQYTKRFKQMYGDD